MFTRRMEAMHTIMRTVASATASNLPFDDSQQLADLLHDMAPLGITTPPSPSHARCEGLPCCTPAWSAAFHKALADPATRLPVTAAALFTVYFAPFAGSVEVTAALRLHSTMQPASSRDMKPSHHNISTYLSAFAFDSDFSSRDEYWRVHASLRAKRDAWERRLQGKSKEVFNLWVGEIMTIVLA